MGCCQSQEESLDPPSFKQVQRVPIVTLQPLLLDQDRENTEEEWNTVLPTTLHCRSVDNTWLCGDTASVEEIRRLRTDLFAIYSVHYAMYSDSPQWRGALRALLTFHQNPLLSSQAPLDTSDQRCLREGLQHLWNRYPKLRVPLKPVFVAVKS